MPSWSGDISPFQKWLWWRLRHDTGFFGFPLLGHTCSHVLRGCNYQGEHPGHFDLIQQRLLFLGDELPHSL